MDGGIACGILTCISFFFGFCVFWLSCICGIEMVELHAVEDCAIPR